MSFLFYISNMMIPAVLLGITIYGISKKVNVYDEFIAGARKGIHTVFQIMPTLIGLMVAVGIMRASGILDMLSEFSRKLHFICGISISASSIGNCSYVFFFSGNRISFGYFQRIWNRFAYWNDCLHYDELYGNGILYNVGLLYGSEGDENQMDFGGSID